MNETVMNYNKYDTDTNYSFIRYIIKQMIFFFGVNWLLKMEEKTEL